MVTLANATLEHLETIMKQLWLRLPRLQVPPLQQRQLSPPRLPRFSVHRANRKRLIYIEIISMIGLFVVKTLKVIIKSAIVAAVITRRTRTL